MVKSKYIVNILELLLDDDKEGVAIRPQLDYLTDINYDYTSRGLFVRFSHSEEISKYRYIKDNLILNGVKIKTTEYAIEADATLFLKNGVIDYLEIWCYDGDYPKTDLTKYTLTQIWKNSPGRLLTVE